MANARKGGGKQQEFVARFEVPLSEENQAHKPQTLAANSQGAAGRRASRATSASISGGGGGGGGANDPTLIFNIVPASGNVIVGQPIQVTALEQFPDLTVVDVTSDATWGPVSNATIDNSSSPALVTGLNASSALVTASIPVSYTDEDGNDLEGIVTVSFAPSAPSGITVAPATALIPVGGPTQQFQVSFTDSSGANIPVAYPVQWNSSNSKVATVNANGIAASVAAGQTNISASLMASGSNVPPGNAVLTVDTATLQSITVQAVGPGQQGLIFLGSGETLQLRAIANYSDNTTQDVTSLATWSSDNPSAASVSMGQVTGGSIPLGANTASANITATYSGVTSTPAVAVTVLLNFPDLGSADAQAFANAKSKVNQLLTAFERRGNLSDAELAQLQDGLEMVTQYLNNNPSTPVPNFNSASKAGNAVSDLSLLAITWNADWTKGPIGTGSRKANVIDDRFRAVCDYLYGPPPVVIGGASLEHDPGSFPGGNGGNPGGLTNDQLRVAAIYGYVFNSQATPPPYRAVPSPLIVDDPSQRTVFNQTVEAADARFRSNTQLYIAVLQRLIQTSQMPQINVGDLAAVVEILVQQAILPSNPQLNTWIDRALATAQNVGQDAPPSQISISLPDLEQSVSSYEIIPDNIFALQPAYFCSMLEELKVFQVVEKLVELFQNGVLPVVKGTAGNVLFDWWKNAALRVSESERRGFYARALGFPGGDADSPNREFKDLFMRFVSAVSSFVRQNTVDNLLRSNIPGSISQQQVRKSARDLATNISSHGYGIAYPMATELQKELTDVMNILTNGEVQGAYGAKDMWQLVDQVAALELGGNKNSVKYRTMASSGAVVFAWLAKKSRLLATNSYVPILDITQLQSPPSYGTKPTTNPSDFDLVGACDQWLAVTGTQEDTVEQQAQPVEAPVMPSRPIQIPSVARDMLESVGIPAMSYAAGAGNGKANVSGVNWRFK